ncbi:MAG: thermonuclease family protein [Methanobacterium sp.]
MSYFIIEGTFHVKGKQPDGDSVRFIASNPANWKKLNGPRVGLNDDQQAQLRMEAIDALETHYKGCHQPWKCATTARTYLLKQLKIKNIVWNEKQTKVTSAIDGTKGYILTNEIEPYHRPVSFVFTGEPEEDDGSEVFLDSKWLKKSLNYKLIKEGLAYPTYYENFFPELREEFNQAVDKVKKKKTGIWPYDKTNTGVSIEADSVTEDIILPKLFRRIVGHLKKGGKPEGFINYLKTDEDPIEIASTGESTNLSEILVMEGDKVKLIPKIGDLVFTEKKPKPKVPE